MFELKQSLKEFLGGEYKPYMSDNELSQLVNIIIHGERYYSPYEGPQLCLARLLLHDNLGLSNDSIRSVVNIIRYDNQELANILSSKYLL